MQAAVTTQRSIHGFTLVELAVVMVITAILVTVGAPELGNFLADQRVRTSASDLTGDIAFARAKAVEESRRVYIQKLGVNWENGWRIYADRNDNAAYDAGEEIKVSNGFTGRIRLCTNVVAEFDTNIIFRPDGRIVRTGTPTSSDGLYVIDQMGGTTPANYKVRAILFGLSGRTSTINLNGTLPPC